MEQTIKYTFPVIAILVTVWLYHMILPPHMKLWGFNKYKMPSGPNGRPFVGSLLEWLDAKKRGAMVPWLIEQARYGEMTTLSMGTKTWVLLNSPRVVNEIIARRAAITHERPYMPVASGLVSKDKRVFLQKTDDWRDGRRLIHSLVMGAESKNHGKLAEDESLALLRQYLTEPEAWYAHHYRFAVSIMHQIVSGTPLAKSRTELENLQKVTSTFLTSINSSLVEFFPQLTKLPKFLQLWRPHWEAMGNFHYGVFRHWWKDMQPLLHPDAGPSFIRDSALGKYKFADEEQAMYLTMLIIVAGADNPRMAMNAFIMAALSYPDVMIRARQELDQVCESRLPCIEDMSRLPYTSAVVKEVLRWRPVVPLVPQRMLVEDLEFEGYTFPAGTEFLVNSLPVSRAGHQDPESFMPERWLKDEKLSVEQDLWQWAFSAGRRSCVGYKLAQKELFISFARLAYCFDFKATGPFNDRVLNAFSPGEPFPVRPTARSEMHEHLIRTGETV